MTASTYYPFSDPLSRLIQRGAWGTMLWVALCPSVLYGVELPANLQFHGFASQAFIWTSDNDFFGESEDSGTFDFRELGVNSSWQALPSLRLSLQVVARWAGAGDDGSPRVDFGFIDYSLLSDADNLWGVRLGRIINPLGLYNDTRDVAFTRPSILLPQSIYFDSARNLALSADGVQLYGERRTAIGDFFFQVNGGLPRVEDPEFEREIFTGEVSGSLEAEPSLIGRLRYERDGGLIRLALTGGQINADYNPGRPIDPLDAGSFRFEPWILSAQYNAERWSITGEFALRRTRLKDFGSALPDVRFTGESYYLQATYRFTPRWEGMLRYDVLYIDRDDRDGDAFAAATGSPAHSRFAKDLTVGLRWDITPSLMLRAEFHHIDGTGWLPIVDNPDVDATERHWNLFSILASYRF